MDPAGCTAKHWGTMDERAAEAAPAGRGSAAVRWIRKLQQRRHREQSGRFFIESFRLVLEALRQGTEAEFLVATPEGLACGAARELLDAARMRGVRRVVVTPEAFASISARDGPEGMGAVVKLRWHTLEALRPGAELCWVALDAVHHPGNMGTILRVCDAVGAGGVLLLGHGTDPYDPMAVRASLGAIFSQRLVRTTLAELVRWCDCHGCMVVGTSPRAPTDYRQVTYRRPTVLMMGSEQGGLSPEALAACHQVVRIPMVGRCESLNVAVAVSVLLYEVLRQRRGE